MDKLIIENDLQKIKIEICLPKTGEYKINLESFYKDVTFLLLKNPQMSKEYCEIEVRLLKNSKLNILRNSMNCDSIARLLGNEFTSSVECKKLGKNKIVNYLKDEDMNLSSFAQFIKDSFLITVKNTIESQNQFVFYKSNEDFLNCINIVNIEKKRNFKVIK